MDFNEFKKQCMARGLFKESGHHNSEQGERVRLKGRGIDINRILGFNVDSPNLGFKVQAVLAAEDAGEFIYISGTSTKDGIYYFADEPCFVSVEELESGDFEEIFDEASVDPDEYEELPADEKVAVFEKAEQINFTCKTFNELLDLLEKAKF